MVCPKEFSLAGEFGLPEITTHPPGTAHPSQRLPLFRSHISLLICCEYFLTFCIVFCRWVKAEEVPGVLSTPPSPEHCRVHPRACCSPRRLPQAWLFAGAGWNQSVSNGFKTQCWGCEAFFLFKCVISVQVNSKQASFSATGSISLIQKRGDVRGCCVASC